MKEIRSLIAGARRNPKKWLVLLGVGLVYLLPILSIPGLAAVFIKIGDIKGESTDKAHQDWIDVQSVNWGISRAVSSSGTGGPRETSAPQASEVTFSKPLDKASPVLMLNAAAGDAIPEVTLHFTRTSDTGGSEVYYTITLSDVLVSSYATGASSSDERPMESLSLNYSKIQVSYTPQNPDGSKGAPIEAGYDIRENKPQ